MQGNDDKILNLKNTSPTTCVLIGESTLEIEIPSSTSQRLLQFQSWRTSIKLSWADTRCNAHLLRGLAVLCSHVKLVTTNCTNLYKLKFLEKSMFTISYYCWFCALKFSCGHFITYFKIFWYYNKIYKIIDKFIYFMWTFIKIYYKYYIKENQYWLSY